MEYYMLADVGRRQEARDRQVGENPVTRLSAPMGAPGKPRVPRLGLIAVECLVVELGTIFGLLYSKNLILLQV